ncbi:hypothetical protein Q5794_22755 [Priestia megaterium]
MMAKRGQRSTAKRKSKVYKPSTPKQMVEAHNTFHNKRTVK